MTPGKKQTCQYVRRARPPHALPSFRTGCCALILAFITGLLVASGTFLAWYHWIAGAPMIT
ncbi:TPA: hypothetical protein G8S33_003850 [Salmonella enterica]|uniref:Uncharacterized protein n=1 Tax=Salmonella enterica TaxID=28901 RepID=A0A756VDJ7_SALER|nr:hypothetical protein [Salmonella enterica]